MPLYEYECQACGRRTETLQRFSDAPLTVCTECGGELQKLLSAPAFQFKGTGWYVTDYGGKGGGDSSSSSGGEGGGKDSSGDKSSSGDSSKSSTSGESKSTESSSSSSKSETKSTK